MIALDARLASTILGLALCSVDNNMALGAQPDLGVSVLGSGSDLRPVAAPGQSVSFRIGLDNMNGAVDAHHVSLSAVLPNGLTFQSATPPPTRIEGGNRPLWDVDTVRAKALPRLFEVTAETDATIAPGSRLEISAIAKSAEGNANSDHDHDSYTIYVQPVGPALVFLGSTLDSILLATDGPSTFTVDLSNAGNLPAIGTRLEATLPKEIKFDKSDPQPESSSGQIVAFKLGDLARAESRSVMMTVEFDPHQVSDVLQADRPLTFSFKVAGAGSDGKVTDSHFEITKHIESAGQDVAVWLAIEGAKVPGELSPGDDVTCVITYANLGNQAAHNVSVALRLGSGLTIAQSDPRPAGTSASDTYPGGVAHWNIGDLGVGMSHSIQSIIHVTMVPDEGALMDATVTADGVDLDASNNTASLLWHSPLPSALAPARQSALRQQDQAALRMRRQTPNSHLWRYVGLLLLVLVAVVIVVRARRNGNPPPA
jgi:uncharacterized repeat protein (TIGR01451 family)